MFAFSGQNKLKERYCGPIPLKCVSISLVAQQLLLVLTLGGGTAAASKLDPLVVQQRFPVPNVARSFVRSGDSVFLARGTIVERCNLQNGKVVWRVDLTTVLHNSMGSGGPATANLSVERTALTGKNLILEISQGCSGHVVALNIDTGAMHWHFAPALLKQPQSAANQESDPHSPPVIVGDKAILRMGSNLVALRLADGKEVWRTPYDVRLSVPPIPNGRPAVMGLKVFFNSDYGIAYAFDGNSGKPLWSTLTDGFKITGQGTVVNINMTYTTTAPVLDHGSLIVSDGTGMAYALSPDDGKIRWKSKTGYVYQFQQALGKLYAATPTGLAEINSKTGNIVRRYATQSDILTATVVGRQMILAFVKGGFSLFDLDRWASIGEVKDFTPITNPVYAAPNLIMVGSPDRSFNPSTFELRSYRLKSVTK